MSDNSHLSRQAWLDAALPIIATAGTRALSVEGLAKTLGVTKGSFYWHFQDRADLIRGCLSHWESEGVEVPVARASEEADPALRLRRIIELAFTDDQQLIEAGLLSRASDHPDVATTAQRVTRKRLVYLERCYLDLGLDPTRAAEWSTALLATHVGQAALSAFGYPLRLPPAVVADIFIPDGRDQGNPCPDC